MLEDNIFILQNQLEMNINETNNNYILITCMYFHCTNF